MDRKKLLKSVSDTMVGVAKSGSPSGLDFLIFDGEWVRSFNSELSVSSQVPTGIKGAVKAHELVKVLEKMEGEDVKIISEKDKIIIKDTSTTLKMTKMNPDTLGEVQKQLASLNTNNLKWKIIPKGFSEGLEICLFAAGISPELGILAGVSFKGENIISTDNYRITHYIMEGSLPGEFTLPTEVVNGLRKFGSEFKSISIQDSWVHFKDQGELIISVRRLMGEYPTEKIIDIFETNFRKGGKESKTYTLPKGIAKSIERAEILAGSGDDTMDFLKEITILREGKYLVMVGKKDAGTIEERIKLEEKEDFPDGLSLKISPNFLKKIIPISRSFQLNPDKTTILFREKNFKHLVVAKVV